RLGMTAATGIGSALTPFPTQVANLEAATGTGRGFIRNTGPPTIAGVRGPPWARAVPGAPGAPTHGAAPGRPGARRQGARAHRAPARRCAAPATSPPRPPPAAC